MDSSAPETTSSDNSPTIVRRSFGKPMIGGASSDSESSGRSSDSVASSGSNTRPQRPKNSDSPSTRYQYTLEPRNMKIQFRLATGRPRYFSRSYFTSPFFSHHLCHHLSLFSISLQSLIRTYTYAGIKERLELHPLSPINQVKLWLTSCLS